MAELSDNLKLVNDYSTFKNYMYAQCIRSSVIGKTDIIVNLDELKERSIEHNWEDTKSMNQHALLVKVRAFAKLEGLVCKVLTDKLVQLVW